MDREAEFPARMGRAMGEKALNPHPIIDDPVYVELKLCEAYRETLEAKIKSIRNEIVGAISISSAILALIMYLFKG